MYNHLLKVGPALIRFPCLIKFRISPRKLSARRVKLANCLLVLENLGLKYMENKNKLLIFLVTLMATCFISKCQNLFYMVRHGKVSTTIVTDNKSSTLYVVVWRRENVRKQISEILWVKRWYVKVKQLIRLHTLRYINISSCHKCS